MSVGGMGRPVRFVLVFVALAVLVSCHRRHVDGTVGAETVLKAWAEIGFDGKAVVSVDPEQWGAGACSRGPMGTLDVLLCEYESGEALDAAEKKAFSEWEEENVPTGVLARNGRTLLTIADRGKVDPTGRVIMRLITTFREQK